MSPAEMILLKIIMRIKEDFWWRVTFSPGPYMDRLSPCYKCWHLTSIGPHETRSGVTDVLICYIYYTPDDGNLAICTDNEIYPDSKIQANYRSVIKLSDPEMLSKMMSKMDELYNKVMSKRLSQRE